MPKKDRYAAFKFAKGWASVSQISGLPGKPFLQGWYYKNCAHTKPTAYQIVKESQKIGNLMDVAIQHFCEDKDIPEVDESFLRKGSVGFHQYFQSLQNFHAFVDHYKPEMVNGQLTVWSKTHKYIGSLDRLFRIKGKMVLGDWKATNSIGRDYLRQLEAYYRAFIECVKTGDLVIEGIDESTEWHENPLWLCQFPKKEPINFDKHVVQFTPSDDRFENGFLALLKSFYQDKRDKEILK